MTDINENQTTTECYYCKEAHNINDTIKINFAVSGPLFPFCCEDHKNKWGDSHFGVRPTGPKYKTIEECQQKLREWGEEARRRRLQKMAIEDPFGQDDLYETTKEIFS